MCVVVLLYDRLLVAELVSSRANAATSSWSPVIVTATATTTTMTARVTVIAIEWAWLKHYGQENVQDTKKTSLSLRDMSQVPWHMLHDGNHVFSVP